MAIHLTKPGLLINGNAQYFDTPAERDIAFARASAAGLSPTIAEPAANSIPPVGASDPAGADDDVNFVPQPPAAPQPVMFQPSFRQATLDQNGMAQPMAGGPATTRLGKLFGFLGLAARGALDAAAGGALNAPRQGQSNFGEGAEAAQAMPFLRAQREQAEERGALTNQEPRANIGLMPLLRAATLARQAAQTQYLERRINAPILRRAPNGVAQFSPDGTFQGIVPGTEPNPKAPTNTAETRKAFADANPDLFTNDQDRADYILGTHPQRYAQPNEWTTRWKAAQGDPDAIAVLAQRNREQQRLAQSRKSNSADPSDEGLSAAESRLLNADPAYQVAKRNLGALFVERAKHVGYGDDEGVQALDADIARQQAIMGQRLDAVRSRKSGSTKASGGVKVRVFDPITGTIK